MVRIGFSWTVVAVAAAASVVDAQRDLAVYRALPSVSTTSDICYDLRRDRCVVAGWTFGPRPTFETWEFDGSVWSQRPTTQAPTFRGAPAVMTYDTVRGVTLLFDGVQTWTYDGDDWTLRPTATTPINARTGSARDLHRSMAFDEARGVAVLLFSAGSGVWEWDGVDWSRPPTQNMIQLYGSVVAWDPNLQRVIRANGRATTGIAMHRRTYSWSGAHWVVADDPVQQPFHFPGPGIATDRSRGLCVTLGAEWGGAGWSGFSVPTFTVVEFYSGFVQWPMAWHGGSGKLVALQQGTYDLASGCPLKYLSNVVRTWTPARGVELTPLPRGESVWYPCLGKHVAVDAGTGEVHVGGCPGHLVFDFDSGSWSRLAPPATANAVTPAPGGQGVVFVASNLSTTTFVGGSAVAATPAAIGYPLWQPAAAASPTRGAVVLFGGFDDSSLTTRHETFEWRPATGFQLLAPANRPSSRRLAAMCERGSNGRVVLHGGLRGNTWLGDTWQWDGLDWAPLATGGPVLTHPSLVPASDGVSLELVGEHPTLHRLELWRLPPGAVTWTQVPIAAIDLGQAVGFYAVRVPGRGVLVLGGALPDPTGRCAVDLQDLRELLIADDAGRAVAFGAACGATPPTLSSFGRPALAERQLRFDLRGSSGSVAVVAGDFAVASLPVGGCTQLLAQPQVLGIAPTSASGFASLPLALPANRALIGLDLAVQAAVLDGGPAFGLSLSNGVLLHVGD